MSSLGMNGTLDSLIEELERLHAQAETEAARWAAEERRLRGMLRAAGVVEEAKPQPKPKPVREVRVSDETRTMVLNAIIIHETTHRDAVPGVPGSFTVKDIRGGFHESSARAAITMLRDEGVVRAVGKVPDSPRIAPLAYARVTNEQ